MTVAGDWGNEPSAPGAPGGLGKVETNRSPRHRPIDHRFSPFRTRVRSTDHTEAPRGHIDPIGVARGDRLGAIGVARATVTGPGGSVRPRASRGSDCEGGAPHSNVNSHEPT